ncbi:protease modulator HflC [Acidobacteria bacterium ACD]|nr:MAG: protease modulator HflC [Acidobacteriota bacterium]MDL1950349.1 protease modulator HflC [Acidobacteria bacterium ACD]
MRRRNAILLAILLAALLADCLVVVDETELALPTLFGRISGGILGPGPHLVAPRPFGGVLRVDRRHLLLRTPPSEYLSADKKNLLLDLALVYRVEDPALFLTRVRDTAGAEARLMDLSIAALGAAAGRSPSEAFFSTAQGAVKLAELGDEIRRVVDAAARSGLGIHVEAAWLTQVHFPYQNREAIVARMRAERDRIARRLRSEGEEAGRKIEAEAEMERRVLLAEAARDAEVTRGRGEAEATRLYAEAWRLDPQLYDFVRALSTYEKALGEGTTFFLDAEGPVMRPLLSPPPAGGSPR